MVNHYEDLSIERRLPDITEAVDPDMVTWENLGNDPNNKMMRYLYAGLLTMACYGVSFYGIKSLYESDLTGYNKNWSISFFVAFVNWIIQLVLNEIGVRRLTKNVADNFIYRTITIATAQVINVIVIYGLAYNSFFVNDETLTDDWGSYGTYNMRWYLSVGTPLVMSIFISIFMPHIDIVLIWLHKTFLRCRDRGYGFNVRCTKMLT